MLRVGLTGDLGSGKSTVARMLAERGAVVLSSDEMARAMMQPGHAVYDEIVARFGESVLAPDRMLDRRKLAALAFDSTRPRIAELNAIIHPAVIAAQAEQIAALAHTNRYAVVVVESALIFSTQHAPDGAWSTQHAPGGAWSTQHAPDGAWQGRFDRIVMVMAPEQEKIARFLVRIAAGRELSTEERLALEADARRRLALQHNGAHADDCIVLQNDGSLEQLAQRVGSLWRELRELEAATR